MKKEKLNIKKVIKAKIDFQQKKVLHENKPILNKKEPPKPIVDPNVKQPQVVQEKIHHRAVPALSERGSRRQKGFAATNPLPMYSGDRDGLIKAYRNTYESLKKSGYKRKEEVDYEAIVCISSFNRFDKVDHLLEMFFEQKSKYKFKVILLDDCSSEADYKTLAKKYKDLEYHRNTKNNGRKLYWYTMTQLWQYARQYTSNTILMIDDDFLLCPNFLNTITDFFYKIKTENDNVIGIAPHLHSYSDSVQYMEWWYNTFSVDGICLFDRKFIELFDYRLEIVTDEELNSQAHAHGWSQIQAKIKALNKMVYKTRYSLVFHDGNDESKLGSNNKQKGKAFTYFFKEKGVDYIDLMV